MNLDPEKDSQFLFLVKEGLKMCLPEGWKTVVTKNKEDIYYIHLETCHK